MFSYIYEAHYSVIDTDKEIIRTISVESMYLSEEECWLEAVRMAFCMMERNETFKSIAYVKCEPI